MDRGSRKKGWEMRAKTNSAGSVGSGKHRCGVNFGEHAQRRGSDIRWSPSLHRATAKQAPARTDQSRLCGEERAERRRGAVGAKARPCGGRAQRLSQRASRCNPRGGAVLQRRHFCRVPTRSCRSFVDFGSRCMHARHWAAIAASPVRAKLTTRNRKSRRATAGFVFAFYPRAC